MQYRLISAIHQPELPVGYVCPVPLEFPSHLPLLHSCFYGYMNNRLLTNITWTAPTHKCAHAHSLVHHSGPRQGGPGSPALGLTVSLNTCTLFPPSAHCRPLSSRGVLSPQMLKWWSRLSPEPRAWTPCRSSFGDTYASTFWPFHCIHPFLLTECPCDDTGSHYQLWSVLSESTAYLRHSIGSGEFCFSTLLKESNK